MFFDTLVIAGWSSLVARRAQFNSERSICEYKAKMLRQPYAKCDFDFALAYIDVLIETPGTLYLIGQLPRQLGRIHLSNSGKLVAE